MRARAARTEGEAGTAGGRGAAGALKAGRAGGVRGGIGAGPLPLRFPLLPVMLVVLAAGVMGRGPSAVWCYCWWWCFWRERGHGGEAMETLKRMHGK